MHTTVLNMDCEKLTNICWQKAIVLVMKGSVTPIEFHDITIMSAGGITFQVPKVVMVKKYVKHRPRQYVVTKRNIFSRDNYTCAYCLGIFATEELTLDHIMPKSRGGLKTWKNIVTACFKCNNKKADRTPEESKMLIQYEIK